MLELNKIYNIDCLDGIKKIDNESIDSIITDPPYCIGMTHNGKKGTFTDLAVCKPFYQILFQEFKRVLKPNGRIYFFTDWRGYAFYYPILNEVFPVKNLLVWNKGAMPGNYYSYDHELIIFASNKGLDGKKAGSNIIKGIPGFSQGAKKTNGEKQHPTQKPTELIAKLIQDSTELGDTILDAFAGSGTTAVAAIKNNRNFICFEIQEKYFNIANTRIKDALNSL